MTTFKDENIVKYLDSVLTRGNLRDNLKKRELSTPLIDEQIWTCVFAMGFVNQKDNGPELLYRVLTEGGHNPKSKTLIEMLPMPPRKGVQAETEGNSNIDLAVGSIGTRSGTESGLQYDPERGNGLCLVEAKWLSDLSYRTSNDPHRNQLTRVIESAVTLQQHAPAEEKNRFPQDVHVTLLTPASFRGNGVQSRLYAYKFREYQADSYRIMGDIEQCFIGQRGSSHEWKYPELMPRLKHLQLHWVTYEEIFVAMPEGENKEGVRDFVLRYGCNTSKQGAGKMLKNEILDMRVFI